jgi:uncharacterized LabA/DUF88 family protein
LDTTNNLAVLIDFENIAAGTEKEGLGRFDVEAVMQRFKDKGRILISRSYADWGRFSRFKQSLLMNNVTMMELTSHGMQDKNRADIAMVVDALELALTRDYIDTFVVVSGDSDFTPLVQKMRELNKRVIGCGTRKSTSRLLVQACDEFVFYDSIVKPRQGRRPAVRRKGDEPMSKQSAFELLEAAIAGVQRENPDPPLASVVKSVMLRKGPDFAESDLGYSSFARFLESAQKAGKIKLTRDTKAGGYRVDTMTLDTDDDSLLQVGSKPQDGTKPQEQKAKNISSDGWADPYLPEGAESVVEALADGKHHILGYPIRIAALEALEQAVTERKKRRRKVNLQFIREDIRKKLRRTHPDVPTKAIKSMLDGLLASGVLMHRDGTAIRNPSAPFDLDKNAQQLNTALVGVYLAYLSENDCDISNTALVAQLFLGASERVREIEESLAWMQTSGQAEQDLNDVDLDDLLLLDSSSLGEDDDDLLLIASPAPEASTSEESDAPSASENAPAVESTDSENSDDAASADIADIAVNADVETEDTAEPQDATDEVASTESPQAKEEEAPAVEAVAEEPKKRKRVRRRKKVTEDQPEQSAT